MAVHDRKTTVWVGKWVRAERGTLSFADGRLRFDGEKDCRFDCALNLIEKIIWHWYSFGGAFEVYIAGASYFVSFVPRHARLAAWHTGLAEGHRWRALLEGRAAPLGPALGARIFMSLYSLIQAFFYSIGEILLLVQVSNENNSMWLRIGAGVMALCLIYLILYLLWQAIITPFRRDA